MSIVTHVMVGAAAGSFVAGGLAGAAVGFVSHVLSDLIPHYDPPLLKKKQSQASKLFLWFLLFLDFALGLIVLYLVKDYPSLFWGGLIGAAVDIDAFFLHKLKNVGIMIHDENSNWHKQTTMFKGLFNQGLLTLVAAVVIYYQIF